MRSFNRNGSTGTMSPYKKRSTNAPIPTVKTMNNGCDRHRNPGGGMARTVLKIDGVMTCKIDVCQFWKGF